MTPVPTTSQCINLLLERVPELRSAYDEHVQDYDGLLPHVFMGDVTRFVVQEARLGETGPTTPVDRICGVLDQCMASGDDPVKEMVCVSFIESLAEHDEVVASLKGLIGPHLQQELRNCGK